VPRVQERGYAIIYLAYDNDANCASIAEAGGIPVVLEAMRQHADVRVVQRNGCMLISILGNNDAICVDIAEAGGIPMILGAMGQHADASAVKEYGFEPLRRW